MTNFQNTVIHADALKILPVIPNEVVDLILTDPPYNVSHKNKKISFKNRKDITLDFGDWDHGQVTPDQYLDDFVRILKPNGVLCMFYHRVKIGQLAEYLETKYNMKIRHIGAWIKTNPTPCFRAKKQWRNGLDLFLVATKNHDNSHHFNEELGSCPEYFACGATFKHWHPTQKPLPLIEWIVSYWSYEGDFVLDPFCGSGTTLVAAKKLRRRYLGIENKIKYVKITKKRLGYTQPYLFINEVSTFNQKIQTEVAQIKNRTNSRKQRQEGGNILLSFTQTL